MTTATMTQIRLRIAMFSESYLPRISGVAHSLHAVTRALRADGHRVLIAAPRYPGYEDDDPDVVRFPSIRPPQERDFPLGLPYSPAAWRRLEDADPDIVHSHSPFLMGAAGGRLARRRRIPLVFTHHTLYDEYVHYAPFVSRRVSAPAVRAYVRAFANRCQAVVVPTRMVASRLRAQGVTARIECIPTAALDIDAGTRLDPDDARATFGIPPGRPVIVTASRLAREKSVDLVLEAFALLRRTHQAVLVVVGGGPEEDALRARARELGVAGEVVFTGLLPHARALDCVAAADLFLYASQTETQGLVVLEAMALGLPVVAVDAGGIPDAVRHEETGFLMAADPGALASQVRLLLDDPARARAMGAAGRAASAAFTLPVVTAQLVALYESLLVPSRRSDRARR
ncbi:MAG TPA: glycosyltransferase [bacterium]|nr:glycosyltransferase [bacterium]